MTPVLWSLVCAEGTCRFQGRIHRLAEFVLSFATTDSGCRDPVVALSADTSKRYSVPEATVTGVKTEDKTMANTEKAIPVQKEKGERKEGERSVVPVSPASL